MTETELQTNVNRRVLIVEDEAKLRQMLVRAVCDMDFESSSVGTAEAGLLAMEEQAHAIVLSDLNLPGIHGLEFCRQIRERWPETQILILTGYGDLDAAKTAIRLDVVDFLTKPCPLGELEFALDRALRRRRHHIIPHIVSDEEFGESIEESPEDCAQLRRLEDVERDHILDTLARHDGNRDETAEELGISIRTLYYRLKQYSLQGFFH